MERAQTFYFSLWFKTNLIYYNVYVIVISVIFGIGSRIDNLDLVNWLSLGIITAISALTPLGKRSRINNLLVLSAFLLSSGVIITFTLLNPAQGEEIYSPLLRITSSLIVGYTATFFVFLLASIVSIFIFLARFIWANRRNLNDLKWD